VTGISEERIARNDAIFRDANEQIERAAKEHEVADHVPFLCECAEETCTEIVRLSLAEYEQVRSDPTHFVNAPGHHVPFAQAVQVIAQRDGYVIVEKLGRAAEVAEKLDPRTSDDG
jgi:hypothetical protein